MEEILELLEVTEMVSHTEEGTTTDLVVISDLTFEGIVLEGEDNIDS